MLGFHRLGQIFVQLLVLYEYLFKNQDCCHDRDHS